VRPDVLVMAKGLASGFPIAAIGTSDAVMQRWIPGSHGGTYGGNPMGCAAAVATIDIIEREAMSNGSAAAVRLREALLSMMSDTNRIERLSGRGLMIGLKMREASDALKLQNALYERGVLVLTAAGGVLRLMPPLVVNEHETEWFIEAMRSSLAES